MENREKTIVLFFLFSALSILYFFPDMIGSNRISSQSTFTQSSQDVNNLFMEEVQKNVNATRYTIDYSFQTTTSYGGFNFSGNGTEKISRDGLKYSSDSETTVLSQTTLLKSYSIPEGNFSCTKNESQNDFVCQRINQSQLQFFSGGISNPEDQLKNYQDYLQKGIISIKYSGVGNFSGRACDNFTVDFDVEKLFQNLTPQTIPGQPAEIENFSSNICLDKELGFASSVSTQIVLSTSFSLKIDLSLLNFDTNVADKDFILPVPVENVK